MAKVMGIHSTVGANGITTTTLHLADDFKPYYADASAGRSCAGKCVKSVYVGNYDCSEIQIGSNIEIYYDEAVSSKKGTFQSVKKIEVIK